MQEREQVDQMLLLVLALLRIRQTPTLLEPLVLSFLYSPQDNLPDESPQMIFVHIVALQLLSVDKLNCFHPVYLLFDMGPLLTLSVFVVVDRILPQQVLQRR